MKKTDIRISVVIPAYNCEKYIGRCLDSILNQIFPVYEIIIINDGSTDNTLNIIKEYRKKNDCIKLYSQQNLKAAAARNKGISLSEGNYIAFIDSDDFIHESYFDVLVNNLVECDAQVSTCGFYESSDDSFDNTKIQSNIYYVRNNIEILYECCDINKTAIVSPCCKLYLKELFEGIKYPEGRTYEDLATTHRVLYKAEKIVSTPSRLYCYYKTPESVVHGKYNKLNFDSENIAQDERLIFYSRIKDKKLVLKNMVAVQRNRITNYCRGVLYLNDKEAVRKLYKKFLKTNKDLENKEGIRIIDKIIFNGFIHFPWVYSHCFYYIYVMYNNYKRGKI